MLYTPRAADRLFQFLHALLFYNMRGTLESPGALTYQRFADGCNHGLAILCAFTLVPLRAIEDIHERALQPAADSFEHDAATVPPC